MVSKNTRFWILIALVTVSGFSQGMLLPLLAIILEQNGVPSSVNGLHATGLYVGVLIASPFMEKPLQRLGYKPIIMLGGILVFVSLAIFPLWDMLWLWFILRMLVGIGDQALHFGTQTWITSTTESHRRGRNIAYYGLFFGLGFTLGPTMTRLLTVHESLPFIVAATLCFVVWTSMFFVRNDLPEGALQTIGTKSTFRRFLQAGKIAWVPLLLPFGYGFLEATLHGVFPIYGLRLGHDVDTLSLIIPCFAAGSLVSQIPLGILSDKIGRKKVVLGVIGFGSLCFFLAAQFESSIVWLFALFTLAGAFVGSLYSLGVSYMTDMLPQALLPAGNIMCGIAFSIGSISGPYFGGLFVQYLPSASFFYVILLMLITLFCCLFSKKEAPRTMAS